MKPYVMIAVMQTGPGFSPPVVFNQAFVYPEKSKAQGFLRVVFLEFRGLGLRV